MSDAEGMSCLMQLVSKLPCVPRRDPARTACLACTGLLFSLGTFTAIVLAIWRALFPPLPPVAPGSPGGGGPAKVTTMTGFLNVKTDIGLALGGVAVVLIMMLMIYAAGVWINRRPQRMMRAAALATRDQLIDRELGSLSSRVSALALQAPVAQQPTQMVCYEPQARVPLRDQGAFNSHLDSLQEGGIIRVSRDGAVLQEPVWHRRPAARPIEGSRTQVVPRVGGGQEQIPGGNVYYEEGSQTAGASSSTGLAAGCLPWPSRPLWCSPRWCATSHRPGCLSATRAPSPATWTTSRRAASSGHRGMELSSRSRAGTGGPLFARSPSRGPGPRSCPGSAGGMNQEQIPGGHVYYEEGAQTAGASTSTGLAV